MSDQSTIHRTVTLPVPPDAAFQLFTERLGDIKPREHNLLGSPIVETVLEPVVGGGIIDRGADGSECRWGRVLAFNAPDRLAFSWDIGPTWQIETDPERVSRVEIRFLADGSGGTRVELEHSDIDKHGPGWESVHAGVDDAQGWTLYLERFADLAAAEAHR